MEAPEEEDDHMPGAGAPPFFRAGLGPRAGLLGPRAAREGETEDQYTPWRPVLELPPKRLLSSRLRETARGMEPLPLSALKST